MLERFLNKADSILKVWKFKRNHKNCKFNRTVKFKNIENLKIGKSSNIGENSYLYCWNQYCHADGIQKLTGHIEIGDNFNATRNLIIQSCGEIMIGNDVLVASNVFICDYNHGIDVNMKSYLDNELNVKKIKIEDGVWIGQNAVILGGVVVGRKSIIAAGSVVTKDIPEYCMVGGNPARIIKYYDKEKGIWINKVKEK